MVAPGSQIDSLQILTSPLGPVERKNLVLCPFSLVGEASNPFVLGIAGVGNGIVGGNVYLISPSTRNRP